MASTELVTAVTREGKFNKNAARRVRVAGKIPAVIYGAKEPSIAIELDPKQILRILHSDSGHNTIFDVDVKGSARVKAMIVDWQYEPIKGSLLHIDLKRIAMDKAMVVEVPIQLEGIPVGVKNEGGLLEQVGAPEEVYARPQSSFVAEFVGAANRLAGRVAEARDPGRYVVAIDGVGVFPMAGPEGIGPGDPVVGVVRPEDLRIADRAAEGAVPAEVVDVAFLGAQRTVRLRSARLGELVATTPAGVAVPSPGTEAAVSWEPSAAWVVPASPAAEA